MVLQTLLIRTRSTFRSIVLVSLLLIYTALWLFAKNLPTGYKARLLVISHRGLMWACGVRIRTQGQPQPGVLGVINHISWLDAHVIGAALPSSQYSAFVTKADVERWPLVRSMIKNAGAIFIRRGAHDPQHLRPKIAHALRAGQSIFFFPEATTLPGNRLGYFFPRLFAAAQDTGAAIQPIAIRYQHAPGQPETAPFVGHVSFVEHLKGLLRAPYVEAIVTFLPVIDSQQPRRQLANVARQSIAKELSIVVSEKQENDIDIHKYCDYLREFI